MATPNTSYSEDTTPDTASSKDQTALTAYGGGSAIAVVSSDGTALVTADGSAITIRQMTDPTPSTTWTAD